MDHQLVIESRYSNSFLRSKLSEIVPKVLFQTTFKGFNFTAKKMKLNLSSTSAWVYDLIVTTNLTAGNKNGVEVFSGTIKFVFELKIYAIDKNIEVDVSLPEYHWEEEPKLKIGIIKLPVKKILSKLIELKKDEVCQKIEEDINLKIKESLGKFKSIFGTPILVNKENEVSLIQFFESIQITPPEINQAINHLFITFNNSHIALQVGGQSDLLIDIPNINLVSKEELNRSSFEIVNSISYAYIKANLNKKIKEKELPKGLEEIVVSKIEELNGGLVVTGIVQGYVDANFQTNLTLDFNHDQQLVNLKVDDLTLLGANFLKRSMLFLIKEKIITAIESHGCIKVGEVVDEWVIPKLRSIENKKVVDELKIDFGNPSFKLQNLKLESQNLILTVNTDLAPVFIFE